MGESAEVRGIGKAANLDFQCQRALTGLAIGHEGSFEAIFENHMAITAMVKWRLGNGIGPRGSQAKAQSETQAPKASAEQGKELGHGLLVCL